MIELGQTYRYTHKPRVYALPEYAERSGQLVEVVLIRKEEDTVMFRRIRFQDGRTGYVYEEEMEAVAAVPLLPKAA